LFLCKISIFQYVFLYLPKLKEKSMNCDILYRNSRRLIMHQSLEFKRELYSKINWNARFIGIKGPKGVGKSTMLLQYIKENLKDENVLYVSLDDMWFATNSIMDLVEYHYVNGGTHLFLDEIHKCAHWQTYIKNIYDNYPTLKVVFTGSSMLQIEKGEGDLSRRVAMYTMNGMSFREYLNFEGILDHPVISLEDLLTKHVSIASDITEKIRIIPHFKDYCKFGYYPFYKEDKEGFHARLNEVCRQVIESDIPSVEKVEYITIQKLKKLLMIIALQVPFVSKMDDLYTQLETTREQGLKLLELLQRGALLGLLKTKVKAVKQMAAPEKMFLDNPNLMYAFNKNPEIGTIRETFFYNQVSRAIEVYYPKNGDFQINDNIIIEVGGADKSFNQIKDIPNSYLAIDNVEFGRGNKIPLWLFGFLY